jgi:hypothetical protein
MMMLSDILTQSAQAALALQAADGSMPPGHNGPYHDPETPVRNTAHWLMTWLRAHELSGETQYRDAAERAVVYLTSPDARPMQATFWCRRNPRKDFANGLVGQAWAIEGLVAAAQAFGRDDLLDLAEAVFLLHPYDGAAGGWRKVNVDGSYNSLDYTFNHQLWFAAAGGLLHADRPAPEVDKVVQDFLARLDDHLTLYRSGLVRHKGPTFLAASRKRKVWGYIKQVLEWKTAAYMQMKSVGYHGFNLYGLALLKTAYPQHAVWQLPQIAAVLRYATSDSFRRALETSKYGYPYNPPGFEVPYAFQVFGVETAEMRHWWVGEQIRRSFDFETDMMRRGTEDEITFAARLYEATRLEDCPVPTEAVAA